MIALVVAGGYPHQGEPVGVVVPDERIPGWRARWAGGPVADRARDFVTRRLTDAFFADVIVQEAFLVMSRSSAVYSAWVEVVRVTDGLSLGDLYAVHVEEHRAA